MRRQLNESWRRLYESAIYVDFVSWLGVVAAHPWTRACRSAVLHAAAFLVGETFEDELGAFSKQRLVVDDSYRDRLLAAEIADLVDLGDALQLSIQQRQAFFRCFLHLDYMRRAGVSRSELLRYCDLRETPATRHLLPSEDAFAVAASSQRSDQFRTQRWDVVQLLSLMFSLCTMPVVTIIDSCVQQIAKHVAADPEAASEREEDGQRRTDEQMPSRENLVRMIQASLWFSSGVPSPVEQQLVQFLSSLYQDSSVVDFAHVHGAKTLTDVVYLFPVLLFPCVWVQRVIKKRVMGEATWRKLSVCRSELEVAGLLASFASAATIVEAAQVVVHTKQRTKRLVLTPVVNSDHNNAQRSTPRKVLPDATDEVDTSGKIDTQTHGLKDQMTFDSRVHSPKSYGLTHIRNGDDAWKVTADSAMATAFVWQSCRTENVQRVAKESAALFKQTLEQVQQNTLPSATIEMIQRFLIREYGYQFTMHLISKSSLHSASGDYLSSSNVKKDEVRARQRYRRAKQGLPLVEDKAIYWKQVRARSNSFWSQLVFLSNDCDG